MERKPGKLLGRHSGAMQRVIADSVRVKADVVSSDEKESGLRRILNFGHTIGHALEAATEYTHFLHGEAVAWGMIAAAAIARDAGFCRAETAARITAAIHAYGPLPPVVCDIQNVMDRLISDKKTVAGAVHFVLPQKIGKVKISSDVPLRNRPQRGGADQKPCLSRLKLPPLIQPRLLARRPAAFGAPRPQGRRTKTLPRKPSGRCLMRLLRVMTFSITFSP